MGIWGKYQCEGANRLLVIIIILFMDNSDSPSILEQLSQGPSFSYNTFISNSSQPSDVSYALCLVPSLLQHV